MAGELSQDEQYAEEFQTLIEQKAQEVYPDQDPILLVYEELAGMVVLCTRLYVSLRKLEENLDEALAKYIEEHEGE